MATEGQSLYTLNDEQFLPYNWTKYFMGEETNYTGQPPRIDYIDNVIQYDFPDGDSQAELNIPFNLTFSGQLEIPNPSIETLPPEVETPYVQWDRFTAGISKNGQTVATIQANQPSSDVATFVTPFELTFSEGDTLRIFFIQYDEQQYPNVSRFTVSNILFTLRDVPVVNANICFPASTPIVTDNGIFEIGTLYRDIENNSIKHSINGKPISSITKTTTYDKELICFEKDSISNGIPSKRTVMSRNHKVSVNGKMYPARMLIKDELIYTVPYTGEYLYNVLLDTHEVINVNNLLCETLDPRNEVSKLCKIMKSLSGNQTLCRQLVENFNQNVSKHTLVNDL